MKKVIEIDDVSPIVLSGANDENIKLIEEEFDTLIILRGNKVSLDGKKKEVELISKIFQSMISIAVKKEHVSKNDVKTLINLSNLENADLEDINNGDDVIILNSYKGPILAKTNGQKKYFKAILKNDIVFAVGPAGTGKTYQAVASAVSSLKRKEVSKIVITRPAVEAGERLGFLPGDLKDKVDPYLTPLYDALNHMIPKDKLKLYLSNKTIEIAPLAYMRGRTLHNSFMILDEAQNATQTQMKMFLTRLGVTSKAIITGDITQIDLPPSDKSGLLEATQILGKVKGIEFIKFSSEDVVRHQLVKNIINAYEESNEKK
ncbi:MAG: phosphate starvation-inducible protein PhoH [Candidatus Marinimicrobia bacterium]|nr:phosphate starvation-inducible protein PhoH [Candidatus Neomarinimicrobiota bacterium]